MTNTEASRAIEQQTPVMYWDLTMNAVSMGVAYGGPVLVVRSAGITEGQSVRWLLSDGVEVQARQMRPATAHELLTYHEEETP